MKRLFVLLLLSCAASSMWLGDIALAQDSQGVDMPLRNEHVGLEDAKQDNLDTAALADHIDASLANHEEQSAYDQEALQLKEQLGVTDHQVVLLREVSDMEMQINELQNTDQNTAGGLKGFLGSVVMIEFAHRVLCSLDKDYPVCNLKEPVKFMKDVWNWSPWFGTGALIYSAWSVLGNLNLMSFSALRYIAERQVRAGYTSKLSELKQNLKMTGNYQLAEQL
jgi:hypothetical protein